MGGGRAGGTGGEGDGRQLSGRDGAQGEGQGEKGASPGWSARSTGSGLAGMSASAST
jgi:hypothetical protein